MKVDLKINPKITEITVVIEAPKMTLELMTLMEMLEEGVESNSLLVSKKDDKMFIIKPDDVDIIRTEDGKVKLYNQQGQSYIMAKSLQDIFNQLSSNFVRISKSTIVNISRVDHVSNSFSGTMYIMMKNGIDDYISRKFLGDFKNRLGI